MTGEEMERAIEFLLQSQANFEGRMTAFDERLAAFDTRLERMQQQLSETNQQLQSFADTQAQLIQTVTRFIAGQERTNAELRAAQLRTAEALRLLAAAQTRTDERLSQTNESLRNLAESQVRSDERLNQTNDNVNSLAETVRRFVESRG
jgi:chromosome segregation ATPase